MEKIVFNPGNELKVMATEMLETNTMDMWFVKDQGCYLLNEHKRTDEQKKRFRGNTSTNLVAYGDWVISKKETISLNPKYNPNCWEDCRCAVGGDDFGETITLTKDMLEYMVNNDNYKMFIKISPTTLTFGLEVE